MSPLSISARMALALAAAATASLLGTSGQALAAGADREDSLRSPHAKQFPRSTVGPTGPMTLAEKVPQSNRRARASMLAVQPNVTLTPCEDDPSWLCGSIRVPFDRAHPNGRKLSLAFAVFPHTNPDSTAKDALFASDGGPGASNLVNKGFLQFINEGLTDDRDLFIVDHRGTGSSGAIDCPELQQIVSDFDAEPNDVLKAVGRCGQQLGRDADRYGSGDIAMDIDAVRAALGYQKISMYGLSYAGTFLSAYATRYPGRLRAVVVDAGTPATDPRHSWTWGQDIPPAMADVVELACLRAPACAAAQPRASSALARLAAAVRRHPVSGTVNVSGLGVRTVKLDEFDLVTVAGDTLNQAELAATAQALKRGDKAPLLRLGGEAMRPFEPAPSEEDSAGDNVAAFCNDNDFVWDRTDPVAVRQAKYRRALAAKGPGAFAPFSPRAWTEHFLSNYCVFWPAPDRFTPAVPHDRTLTGVPVLILSGDFDTVVPTRTTRELLRVFPKAVFVRIPGAGHPAAGWSDCARLGMQQFIRSFSSAQVKDCDEPGWVTEATSKFPVLAADATPATSTSGDQSTKLDRRVATATVQTVRDMWLRSFRVPGDLGTVTGLRGGSAEFDYTAVPVATMQMHGLKFSRDVVVTGDSVLQFDDSRTTFTAMVNGPGGHDGRLTAAGGFGGGVYEDFVVTGTLGGQRIAVAVPAN
ncbi:MAG: hypothetical protein JWR85_328 [Marmoricola sp.]|nr:hypothetical protein [Marmoricola sp.]